MEMKIVGVTLAAFVSLVVLAAVLMPILDDATDVEDTYTNNGLWRMSAFDDNQTWTYDSGSWKLNDVTQISGDIVTNNSGSNAVLGDNWINRANGWIRGETVTGNATEPITIVSGDTVQVSSDGGNSYTTVNKSGYGVDNNGLYLMTAYNEPVYVLGDSPIYATGQSNIGTGRGLVHFEGTIDDGITGSAFAIKNDPYTNFSVTNINIDYEQVSGYVGLYKLNKITATVSCEDGDSNTLTGNVTYSSYVVPYEVTAEKSQHLTDGQNQLLAVIPVLVIVAILLAVIALVIRSKLD